MRKYQWLLCLGIALASSCHSQTPADFVQKTQNLVKEAADKGLFSGTLGIARDGKLVHTIHYGYADWTTKKPFTSSTLFDIGSFNKDYTQELIYQLEKEGRLSLNDPLSKYLVLFGNEKDKEITIDQLIHMRSGLGDYTQAPGFINKEKKGNLNLQDRLDIIKTQPLLFEPGKGKEYSNSGYVVLGAVIEKITGKSYEQNLKERILQPVGLTQTFYSKAEVRNQSNRALGTEMNFKGEKKAIDDVYSDAAPDGGAYASLNDLLLLMTAMHQGKLPSGRKYPKTPLAGGSNYWNTVVIPFEDGTMVLIMSNLEHIADELGRRVYNLGMGKSPAPLEMPREQQLYKNLKEKGISYIEKNMKSILSDFDLPYDARFLNYFGYRFMNGGDTDAALELFALNTRLFPKQANTYDSLGEAWLKKGNNAEAIRWYKKALEVDPAFGNARKMLDQLENK